MTTSLIKGLIDTPEKRMRLFRIFYLIATFMMVLGFIIIVIALLDPNFLP